MDHGEHRDEMAADERKGTRIFQKVRLWTESLFNLCPYAQDSLAKN